MKKRQARDFDRRLWRHFWSIAKLFWVGSEKWKAYGLLLLLIVLLLGRTEFTVLFNEQSGEFTSALAAHDSVRFWHSMRVFGVALAVAVPVYALYYYVRDTLGMSWRRWLTADYVRRYFEGRAFYRLTFDKQIDNPRPTHRRRRQRLLAEVAEISGGGRGGRSAAGGIQRRLVGNLEDACINGVYRMVCG